VVVVVVAVVVVVLLLVPPMLLPQFVIEQEGSVLAPIFSFPHSLSLYQTRIPAVTTPLSKGNGRMAYVISITNGRLLASSPASSPVSPWPCCPKGPGC